jgi:dienelactone hydrolase
MDMTTPTLINYDISAQDSDAVVQVFKATTHQPGVDPDRIGIIGFSGGGPLACFAAADPRIRDQVAFIALSGSYYNATSLLRAFGRRALTVGGYTQPWHPTEVPLRTLANIITGPLPPSEAKRLVHAFAPGGKPLTSSDLAQLSPGSVAAYHLLAGNAPDRVDANIAALPPQVEVLLDELSPSTVIDKIRTPIYLLHDRSDQSIPFTESRDFAAALTRIHHPHDFVEFGIFQHVQVRTDLGASQLLNDVPALFRLLSEVLLSSS